MKTAFVSNNKIFIVDSEKAISITMPVVVLNTLPNLCLVNLLEHIKRSRTVNCLNILVEEDLYMNIEDFVAKYSWKDFMNIRGSGKRSLLDLRSALAKLGYVW